MQRQERALTAEFAAPKTNAGHLSLRLNDLLAYTLRFCPLFEHAELSLYTPAHIGRTALSGLFEHAELSVCTPAHIGKAAMAAMVATKLKVVQQIQLYENDDEYVVVFRKMGCVQQCTKSARPPFVPLSHSVVR